MGALCYFALLNFTVQVSRISKCSQIISASTYFMGTLFFRHTLFFFIFFWKNCYPSLPTFQASITSFELDWSPGFARNYHAASI